MTSAVEPAAAPEPTYQNIARLERRDRTPSWDTVLRLANAMGIATDDFRPKDE